jgi:hypothetical protein
MRPSVNTQLAEIEERIDMAVGRLRSDSAASPTLRAVVAELHRKAREARDQAKGADGARQREYIIETEQAAGSAERAAEADQGVSEVTRSAIIEIHETLAALKEAIED